MALSLKIVLCVLCVTHTRVYRCLHVEVREGRLVVVTLHIIPWRNNLLLSVRLHEKVASPAMLQSVLHGAGITGVSAAMPDLSHRCWRLKLGSVCVTAAAVHE